LGTYCCVRSLSLEQEITLYCVNTITLCSVNTITLCCVNTVLDLNCTFRRNLTCFGFFYPVIFRRFPHS
jgi:hypothetical protein